MALKEKKKSKKGGTSGLSQERMDAASGGGGDPRRLHMKKGVAVTVQFLTDPKGMHEFDMHSWKHGSGWKYVPCSGEDDCVMCNDDDEEISKVKYRFAANVYDHKRKKVCVLEGPASLGTRVMNRWKDRKDTWLKKVWHVTMLDTSPVSYDVDLADTTDPKRVKEELIDLPQYVQDQYDAYVKSEGGSSKKKKSSLDDDDDDDVEDDDDYADDDDDEEDVYTKDQLMEMEWKELKKLARSLDIDTEDKKRKALVREILEEQE